MEYPDNNPKTFIGVTKVPLHLVPPSAKIALAEALADGAKKYGPFNWRTGKISVSVYLAACERHIDAYRDGEELAQDSGVHHLKHAMACLALLLDAQSVGTLNDDRPPAGAAPKLQAEYAAKHKPAPPPLAPPNLWMCGFHGEVPCNEFTTQCPKCKEEIRARTFRRSDL